MNLFLVFWIMKIEYFFLFNVVIDYRNAINKIKIKNGLDQTILNMRCHSIFFK